MCTLALSQSKSPKCTLHAALALVVPRAVTAKKAIERNREAIRVGPKKEAYDIGKDYAEHTLEVTPGQDKKDVDRMLNTAYTKNQSMRETLAKVWGLDEVKSPFQKEEEKPLTKTMTGQKPTKVEVEPKMEKK